MAESPFAGFNPTGGGSGPRPAEDIPAQIFVVLSETAKYLRSRGNDPAMVSMIVVLMGQLELTLQTLARAGIEVPIFLIHNPPKED